MDKFGIFNLLNSFFDFYSKNKQNFPTQNQSSAIPSQNKNENLSPKNPPSLIPLQSSMIKTMNSHDELVKRVMQNQKNKAPK